LAEGEKERAQVTEGQMKQITSAFVNAVKSYSADGMERGLRLK
jgi:hypothetical protein